MSNRRIACYDPHTLSSTGPRPTVNDATSIDFDTFHQNTLQQRLRDDDIAQIARAAAAFGSLGFALNNSTRCYSYYPDGDQLHVRADDAADTLIRLDEDQWQGIAADLETAPALIYSGRVGAGCRGDLGNFMQWEPMLRSLYCGIPLFPMDGTPSLRNAQGHGLDPLSHFSLSDDPAVLRDYLSVMGYVLIRGVFSADEVARLSEAGDQLRAAATADDQTSWWGKDHRGKDVVTRVLNGGDHPDLHALAGDPRILQLQALMPEGLKGENPSDTDAITVLFKTPGMVEGLSDLPWHRDCGMGGHAVMCPVINLSIYLADATPDSGELRFLPGSHRFACPTPGADAGISVSALAGDVSLHFGDVMHGAPPPLSENGPFRASVLMSFKPDFENHRGDRHYNDVLLKDGDGHVSSVPGS